MSDWNPRANELFLKALDLPEPDRPAFLSAACGDDADLEHAVQTLLRAHVAADGFLAEPHPDAIPTGSYADHAATRTTGDSTLSIMPAVGQVGTVIAGRYKLLQQIGEGGMGTVWMADQTEPVKRRVAVKLIRAERGTSATILARFEAERQAIALMDHPHIAKLLDAGTTGEPSGVSRRVSSDDDKTPHLTVLGSPGSPFFVMELVKGIPLTEYCDTHKLSIPDRLHLFQLICGAVQHAHQKGIIHRDLKPTNILVESHDGKAVPKVIDFGLAKATSGMQLTENTLFTGFGTVMGTPLYMAPEQATFNAVDVDTRADIYALGVILYELLTGTTPLTRDTIRRAALDELLRLIREQEAPTPSSRLSSAENKPSVAANRQTEPLKLGRFVKGELDWIVLKALSKERDRRYETANGFAADVGRFLNHEPVTAGPVTARYRMRKFVRRNRPQVIAGSLMLLILLGGIVGTTLGLVEAKQQQQLAVAAQQAEAERAEGERLAKLDAQENEKLAIAAAAAEKVAKLDAETKRQDAERNLAFAKKGNDILGSVFAGLDPKARYATIAELRNALRDNLVKAVKELDGSAIGDPLEVAAMQEKLGLSLLGLGEANLAIKVFSKEFATRKERLGIDHPTTLTTMSNLAQCYQAVGKMEKALPLMEQTLKLRTAKLGAEHPDTLVAMHNLAGSYLDFSRVDEALTMMEETLKLRIAKQGADHPQTLASMNNLAGGYQAVGKMNKALPLMEETLKLHIAKLGAEHPNTLGSMNNLAAGYQAVGKMEKALPLMEQTLKLRTAKLEAEHPDTIMSIDYLVRGYLAVGKLDRALQHMEESLKVRTAKLGAAHPDTLMAMNNLAMGYLDFGKMEQALQLFEQAASSIEKRRFQDLSAKSVIPNTIFAYEEAKQYEKAEAWRRKWLAVVKAETGVTSAAYAGELAALGLLLLKQQKWIEAEPLLREALAIREKVQPDAWTTFNTQSMLDGALLGQKKYADAEPLLLAGYGGIKVRFDKTPAADPARLAMLNRLPEAVDRLIELYTAINKPDEVKKWRAGRAKYLEMAPLPRLAK